jgi:hypothetical protein
MLKVPNSVKVFHCFEDKQNLIVIKGPLGQLSIKNIKSLRNKKKLFIRLLEKAFIGVVSGFVCRLRFVGVGLRVDSFTKEYFFLKLGRSHLVKIRIPKDISVSFPKKGLINIFGIDHQKLMSFICIWGFFLTNKRGKGH